MNTVALWGLDATPYFLLWRGEEMVALLLPGEVLVEEKHKDSFAQLNKMASDISAEVLKAMTPLVLFEMRNLRDIKLKENNRFLLHEVRSGLTTLVSGAPQLAFKRKQTRNRRVH